MAGDPPAAEAAEAILDEALRYQFPDRWRIYVERAELLIQRAKDQVDPDYYSVAYDAAVQAIKESNGQEAAAHFIAGLSSYMMNAEGRSQAVRLHRLKAAEHHFRNALKHDPEHPQARRLLDAAVAERRPDRASIGGTLLWMGIPLCYALVIVFASICIFAFFAKSDLRSSAMFGGFTVALFGLAFALPRADLSKLKVLRVIQAEFSVDPLALSRGPVGVLTSGPVQLDLAIGPIGQVPRRV